MKKNILLSLFLLFVTIHIHAQYEDYGGFVFGAKGGLSVGIQKWNNFQRDPLYTYHAIAFMESLPVEGKFSVFLQGGYHIRGSAIRTRSFVGRDPSTGQPREFSARTTKYEFRNVAVSLGGKQRFPFGTDNYFYYLLGIRGEYTVGTNLNEFAELNNYTFAGYYPMDDFGWVKKWNAGMILGGGVEFDLAERMGIMVELTVNPDLTNQYNQPPIPNVPNPVTGNNTTIQERLIKNTTVELSVGFRFLRLVEYID